MKIELDRVEVEGLTGLLETRYYSLSRKIHRFLKPNCRRCKNEIITINKLKDALGEKDE